VLYSSATGIIMLGFRSDVEALDEVYIHGNADKRESCRATLC